uniref:Reverse transcriptase domain-containing protein n=1 Tax=Cannabis sativa TaxID=3483 RepID=A0A803QN82_CANSA
MGNLVVSYFSDLFSSDGSDADAISLILDCLGPPLDDLDFAFLDKPFTFKEVRKALFHLSGDKAPGLDGLNAYFYQKNWSTLGVDFAKAVLSCLNEGVDFSAVNTTLISLIPKKQNAHTLKDFRLISLCSTLYKVISKVLANRLKVVLDKIISPFQSAFVSGRVIFDNILIAQEIVHAISSRKKGKLGWAALKLDMAKAFDRVNWHYLESLMFHFNFPSRFVSLIMKCISTTSLSFLINGSVHGLIHPSRGLRHGDPLSPYLFILCAEGFSALLRANQVGLTYRAIPSLCYVLFSLAVKLCKGIEAVMADSGGDHQGLLTKSIGSLGSLYANLNFRGLGFRSLIHFNQAMPAKQARLILRTLLLSLLLVLKARYFLRTLLS